MLHLNVSFSIIVLNSVLYYKILYNTQSQQQNLRFVFKIDMVPKCNIRKGELSKYTDMYIHLYVFINIKIKCFCVVCYIIHVQYSLCIPNKVFIHCHVKTL